MIIWRGNHKRKLYIGISLLLLTMPFVVLYKISSPFPPLYPKLNKIYFHPSQASQIMHCPPTIGRFLQYIASLGTKIKWLKVLIIYFLAFSKSGIFVNNIIL